MRVFYTLTIALWYLSYNFVLLSLEVDLQKMEVQNIKQ